MPPPRKSLPAHRYEKYAFDPVKALAVLLVAFDTGYVPTSFYPAPLRPAFGTSALESSQQRSRKDTGFASAAFARHSNPKCCDPFGEMLTVSLNFGGGVEDIVLKRAADCATAAEDFAARNGLSKAQTKKLKAYFRSQWEAFVRPTYAGPTCKDDELQNPKASAELSTLGLILDVADSTLSEGGRGLFIRCAPGVDSVDADEGTVICGYTDGEMALTSDRKGAKSVKFALYSLDTLLGFEDGARRIRDLLNDESIDEIVGHSLIYDDETGELLGISPDPEYIGPIYFNPGSVEPTPSDPNTFGQMANDLAIGSSTANLQLADIQNLSVADPISANKAQEKKTLYETDLESNILSLTFNVERSEDKPSMLIPSYPISTLSRDFKFTNSVPMELGCYYGWSFWTSFMKMRGPSEGEWSSSTDSSLGDDRSADQDMHYVEGFACRETVVDIQAGDERPVVVLQLDASDEEKLAQLDEWNDQIPLVMWGDAVPLAKYLLGANVDLSGKTILELGAGIGLVSIAVSRKATKVLATDRNLLSLSFLRYAAKNLNQGCDGLETAPFDFTDASLTLPPADIVVASDVMYDAGTTEGVAARTLEALQRGSRVIIADTDRGVRPQFLEDMRRSLDNQDIDFLLHQFDDSEGDSGVDIFDSANFNL